MARIRYLKPDFFKDEHIKDLSYEARLFFQGLWTQSDKEGRGEDRPERLKMEILPYDNIDPEKLMQLLAKPKKNSKRSFILRYEIDDEKYYQILQWRKHQKPHHTEQDSKIPPAPSLKTKIKSMGMGNQLNPSARLRNGGTTVKEPLKGKNELETPISAFFDYFLLKTKKAFKLTKDKRELISRRLTEGYTLEQLKQAVDAFVVDDWEDRAGHLDLIYCIGKQKGKPDNLEKWLNIKPSQPKITFVND